MSQLRKQLRAMQAEYRSAKYPGDLACELLTPKRPILKIAGWSTIGAGIAAAIALWVMHGTIVTQPSPGKPTVVVTNVVPTTNATEDTSVVPVTNLASAPEFPTDMSVVPSDGPMVPSATSLDIGGMPSMPSFPSLDLNEENVSTTKESV